MFWTTVIARITNDYLICRSRESGNQGINILELTEKFRIQFNKTIEPVRSWMVIRAAAEKLLPLPKLSVFY
jgi:hypothetical protein